MFSTRSLHYSTAQLLISQHLMFRLATIFVVIPIYVMWPLRQLRLTTSPPSGQFHLSPYLAYAFQHPYCNDLAIGTSVGVAGLPDNGTNGGYVHLRIKSENEETGTYLLLTCHHVLTGKKYTLASCLTGYLYGSKVYERS